MHGQKNWSWMRSSMHSRPRSPTSSWHPFRVTSLCAAGKTSQKRVSPGSLHLALQYRTCFHSGWWFHSHMNWLNSGGSVSLGCCHSRVPSCSQEMTKLRVVSTCWAWCQSSKVMQVICWLSCTKSRMCRSQLYASLGLWGLQGQHLAQLTLLQLWPGGGYLSCQACTPARTPSIRHLHQYWSSQLSRTTRNCSWLSWPPISDLLHPAWPS